MDSLDDKQKQPGQMTAAAYYARPVMMPEDTMNDDFDERDGDIEDRVPQNVNYGSLPQSYPMAPDNFVAGAVRNEEKMKKEEFRCLDMFTKLRGEDERQDFLVKVFGICTLQTLITVMFIAATWINDGIRDYLVDHLWVYFTCFGI